MNEITLNNSDLSHGYEGKDPDGDFKAVVWHAKTTEEVIKICLCPYQQVSKSSTLPRLHK